MDMKATLAQLCEVNARMDADKARQAVLRDTLEGEARRQLADQGVIPSWKAPGLGSATLTDPKVKPDVADSQAFLAWVTKHYPGEVETVTQVRPAFTAKLFAEARVNSDDLAAGQTAELIHAGTGEFIPGLRAVRPDGNLQVRLTPEAKARARAALGLAPAGAPSCASCGAGVDNEGGLCGDCAGALEATGEPEEIEA